jgi:hypothetical protein
MVANNIDEMYNRDSFIFISPLNLNEQMFLKPVFTDSAFCILNIPH